MPPARSITEALDPILVRAGFTPGHSSDDPVAGEVVFCAGHGEFRRAYPHLEAFSLAETLRSAQLGQDAAAADSLTGNQLGTALPRLTGVLEHLFSPATR